MTDQELTDQLDLEILTASEARDVTKIVRRVLQHETAIAEANRRHDERRQRELLRVDL